VDPRGRRRALLPGAARGEAQAGKESALFSSRESKKRQILKLLDRSAVLRPKYSVPTKLVPSTPPSAPLGPATPRSPS
jgi:hypothetical protein